MDHVIIVSFVIAIVAIIVVWYLAKKYRYLPDDEALELHTEEDKLLAVWYQQNIVPTMNFDVDDIAIAVRYLSRARPDDNIEADRIVVGHNLSSQYESLCGGHLSYRYIANEAYDPDGDHFIDLRALIAKTGEIAIIHDRQLVTRLRRNNSLDLSDLHAIMENNFDSPIRKYLKLVLDTRWKILTDLNHPELINSEGSYAYFANIKSDTDNIVEIADGVKTANTEKGLRINLLCRDIEFETLMKRLKESISVDTVVEMA